MSQMGVDGLRAERDAILTVLGPGVYEGTVWVDDRDDSKRGHDGSAAIAAVIR